MVENCTINRILTERDRVVGVETDNGMVECDYFVNAAGTWARKIGRLSNPIVQVPIHPAEHYYLYTYQSEQIDSSIPGNILIFDLIIFFGFVFIKSKIGW